jgi:ABC-2 type transport system permease protein
MAAAPAAARPDGGAAFASLLARETRKWCRVFSVFVQDALVYRAVAVVWILTDTIPALVMPLLWRASFNGRATIAGFTPSDFTAYYLVLHFVTNLIQCHFMWEIATEIKEGRFSAYLIRPFSYRAMHYLGFLSWRLMRTLLFAPVFVLVAFLFRHHLHWNDYHAGIPFFVSLVLGHFVSFFVTYAFGLLALFFVETRSLSLFNF